MSYLNWLAETIMGCRPANSATVTIRDNGRCHSDREYRLIISWNDENGESGKVEVTPDQWRAACMAVITPNHTY